MSRKLRPGREIEHMWTQGAVEKGFGRGSEGRVFESVKLVFCE